MASRLEKLGVKFPYMVGPMVGLSHVAFRELIRSYLPKKVEALLFTEMLSTRRLPSEHLDEVHTLKSSEGERHWIPQLLGNEERFIAPSIGKLLGKSPWGFDINMGCPVAHTLKHNWGVRLMGDKAYAADVVRMTKRHSPLPVSVKLRSGLGEGDDLDYLCRFTDEIEAAGADWMTLHCRPRGRAHDGEANWKLVTEVGKRRSIPVVCNGDLQTAEDALYVVRNLGADGAMIGRAATARPWILAQIALKEGYASPDDFTVPVPITADEEARAYFPACLRFLDLLQKYSSDEAFNLTKFRFFVAQGSRWFHFGHAFWKSTMRGTAVSQVRAHIEAYAAQGPHPIYQRISFV